jgi:hypothetical protein
MLDFVRRARRQPVIEKPSHFVAKRFFFGCEAQVHRSGPRE